MKEISAQIQNGQFMPLSEPDKDVVKEYKPNQIVKLKITGVQKPRSVKQLRTYWAACRLLSDNTDNGKWNTYKKVDWQIRNRLKFYDMDLTLVIDGNVQFKVRSISFKNLKHMEACDYFNRAYDMMAGFLGVTVDAFIEEVKQSCKGR